MKFALLLTMPALLAAAVPVTEPVAELETVEKRDSTCNLDISGGVYSGSCRSGTSLAWKEVRAVWESNTFSVNCVCHDQNIHGLE